MKTRALVLTILALAVAPTMANEHVALAVSPKLAFEPADLSVRATIESNAENRTLEVIAESDGYYRSSVMPLDGNRAPRTTSLWFRSLPGGTYSVRVIVRDARGEALATSEEQATIVGRDGLR